MSGKKNTTCTVIYLDFEYARAEYKNVTDVVCSPEGVRFKDKRGKTVFISASNRGYVVVED